MVQDFLFGYRKWNVYSSQKKVNRIMVKSFFNKEDTRAALIKKKLKLCLFFECLKDC